MSDGLKEGVQAYFDGDYARAEAAFSAQLRGQYGARARKYLRALKIAQLGVTCSLSLRDSLLTMTSPNW